MSMKGKEEFTVTPWKVEGEVDYAKLVNEFGTQLIDDVLLARIKRLAGRLHPLLRLGYFFSHRDLDWVLDMYEKGEQFYIYTGRGPSGSIHLGHILPWVFTRYLQEVFNAKLIFQVTDDEKFLYHDGKGMDEISRYTYENILDIIAVGFNPDRSRIIVDTKHMNHLYPIAIEVAKRITFSTVRATFGFTSSTNIGMILFPAIQAAPCFLPSKIEGRPTPCLIPAAIDQDPYWRVTRDVAEKLGYYKPAQIHSKFLPGLGMQGKMSSSQPETAIFTTDAPEVAERKVMNAYTGGQPTVALQRRLGADAYRCPVFWYLRYMFEDERSSDERYVRCRSGELLCYECKHALADAVKRFLREFQARRERARDMVERFMFE
ncbi:MAG: tryptophan--tRNA ligase [Candidatus Nitrosocaldus sp.]|nr:tryptophan--tRNA ligase [Candidatus Nitrosocaldus sp.]MDW7999497.1 tryptophan--tRNA ligase [Candidatus Nitrosocaldus sp.]